MSAREQAEAFLGDAAGLVGCPELQSSAAATGQGYALLALADAIERHTEQLIASTEYLGDAVARGGNR